VQVKISRKTIANLALWFIHFFLAGPSQDSAFVPGSFENDLFSEQGLALSKTL
jgi:hypothetical protein